MDISPVKKSERSSYRLIYPPVLFVILIVSMIVVSPVVAGGHGDTGELEHKITTSDKSGINLLLAQLYNDHRLIYSLVVTLTMAILGIVVAQVTELLLKLLGAKKLSGAH